MASAGVGWSLTAASHWCNSLSFEAWVGFDILEQSSRALAVCEKQ